MNEFAILPIQKRKRKPRAGFEADSPKPTAAKIPDWRNAVATTKTIQPKPQIPSVTSEPAVSLDQNKFLNSPGDTVTFGGPKNGAKTNGRNNNQRNRERRNRS